MELPIPVNFDPHSPEAAEAVASLPESRGIYLLSIPGSNPHLSWSLNLKRRLTRLLLPSYNDSHRGFARFFEKVTSISCWPAGSRLEASLLLFQITRQHFPIDYMKRLRLRLPWFLVLNLEDRFPRLEIVNRPARRKRISFGPFLTRDLAQRYEQEILGLFQIRRCTEVLDPAPSHPGCIYGEMNQCLRPCQTAVSDAEYANEVGRVEEFLANNGKTAMAGLSTARERASAELDFEQAAQLHKRLEKVQAAATSRDAVIAPLDRFSGVALVRGISQQECRLLPMREGYWQNPLILEYSAVEPGARSLDGDLRERLAASAAAWKPAEAPRWEHLAVFSRWYYSSWRDGHWFPFAKLDDLNYRRLVKEISNLTRAC